MPCIHRPCLSKDRVIVIFGYKCFVFRRHSVAMKGSGNVLFVLFSFAPDIVCCLRGTMRQTFSNTTPSLGQECEWERLRGWCQPLPDGASSIPETPFSSLQQLSRPRDWCGGGGGGTAMQYTTPTLYTSNNKWALIKFFCVLFFYTKLFCEGERGHGVDLYHSSENFIFLSYFLSPWFAKGSKEEPPLHHPSHSDWQANVL